MRWLEFLAGFNFKSRTGPETKQYDRTHLAEELKTARIKQTQRTIK
jgi:hypothetical protein